MKQWYALYVLLCSYENHHVMTWIGNRVNATFMPDNIDHILTAVDIMIYQHYLLK